MKGKSVSKWAIVLASVWIIINSTARAASPFFGAEYGLTMAEIISSASALVIVWTPVYRSIWLDKKLGSKKGE